MPDRAMGLEEVVANSMSGLSFSGFTIVMVLLIAAAFWCSVPFALYIMKRRMASLERLVDDNATMLSTDIRRVTDILMLQRIQSAGEGAKQAEREPAAQESAPAIQPQSQFVNNIAEFSAAAARPQAMPTFIAPRSASQVQPVASAQAH